MKKWKEIIPRFGRWVDMDNAYSTMSPDYTESVWWAFSELYKKGLVFEGYKSMHICPRCETTLAQSEVAQGYKDLTDISVTVKFELEDEKKYFYSCLDYYSLDTTGNVALAINKEFEYVKIRLKTQDSSVKTEFYILAKERVEEVFKKLNLEFEIIETFNGKDLVGKKI